MTYIESIMTYPRPFLSTLALLLGQLLIAASAAQAEEQRFILSSATGDVRRDAFNLSDYVDEVIATRWKVSQRTLHGGLQEGVQVIRVDNGQIAVDIVPTRGMSILQVSSSQSGERLFGWDSPVKEVVHPHYIDLESRGGLGWLQGFNEWMVRCGLEFAGHPGTDAFRTNTGDLSELELTLHGKIGNLPASEVELFLESNPPYRLRLRGVVHERSFYGPKLQLQTDLTMLPGQARLTLSDSITNLGAAPQEYQVIYHTNFGSPILEDGARVVVAAASVTPMNDQAAKSVDSYDVYSGPQLGFIEEVFLVEPLSDGRGVTAAVLHNASKTRGALMRWSTERLPYLTLWKNTAAEADGYVTGIEPGSGFPFNRRIERHFQRVPVLAAGESHSFSVDFSFLDGGDAVTQGIRQVQAIAADRVPSIQSDPPELPSFDE